MLRVTGRLADGWLPSLAYLPREEIPARHQAIDDAARAAGRDPADIRRGLNVGLDDWNGSAEELAAIARDLGFNTLIASVDPADPVAFVRRLGEEVVPQVRESTA
jgi:hypothetical protein